MRKILQAESSAILNIPYSADYDKAVELIVELAANSSPPEWVRPAR